MFRGKRNFSSRAGRPAAVLALLALPALLASVPASHAANDAYRTAIEEAGPMLWYSFAETEGVAVNQGKLGLDYNADYLGTPLRGAPTESGDASVSFNGADDFLESDAAAPESLGGNPTFTAEALFFVFPDGSASLWAPLLHWGVSDGSPTMKSVYFSFQGDNADRVYAGFYNGGLRTGAIAERGRWHHFLWVREGGDGPANKGTTVYFDGVQAELEDDPQLPSNSGTPTVEPTRFRVNRARDFTRFFQGNLDELALYDYAFTAEQAELHYKAAVSDPCAEERCIDYDGGCKTCARPTGADGKPNATDALFVLRRAVGTRGCNPCVCDVDASGNVVATDALLTLKAAVGQTVTLVCPADEE